MEPFTISSPKTGLFTMNEPLSTKSFTLSKWYSINWDAVQTVEDLKVVLKALGISVDGKFAEDHPDIHPYLVDYP